MAAIIGTSMALTAAEQPSEKFDMKSLPPSIQQTINQRAAGGEDDANGRWNYEVVVKTNGNEWGFEVDPNGKFLMKHTEIKK
jgi:hypothetical protein